MPKLSNQVVSNLCLKINSKLGGINHQLAPVSRPPALKKPIMIMGADVSHGAPESKVRVEYCRRDWNVTGR